MDKHIKKISQQIETLTGQLATKGLLSPKQKSDVSKQINTLNGYMTTLSDIAEASAKNHIIDLFSKNMLDLKNRTDLLTPISFKAVKGIRSETLSELSNLLDDESFIHDLQKAGLVELVC